MSKIFERNPDTGEIRSREAGDYGNEKIVVKGEEPINMREEILSDIWAANKVNHHGHWYVRMSDIVRIVTNEQKMEKELVQCRGVHGVDCVIQRMHMMYVIAIFLLVWCWIIWEAANTPTMPPDWKNEDVTDESDKYDDWHPDQDIN